MVADRPPVRENRPFTSRFFPSRTVPAPPGAALGCPAGTGKHRLTTATGLSLGLAMAADNPSGLGRGRPREGPTVSTVLAGEHGDGRIQAGIVAGQAWRWLSRTVGFYWIRRAIGSLEEISARRL